MAAGYCVKSILLYVRSSSMCRNLQGRGCLLVIAVRLQRVMQQLPHWRHWVCDLLCWRHAY